MLYKILASDHPLCASVLPTQIQGHHFSSVVWFLRYFESTSDRDPAQSLVQRVRDDPAGAPHQPECLSCNLTNCLWATGSVSKLNGYLALTCGGPDVPYTTIVSLKGEVRQGRTRLQYYMFQEEVVSR